MRPAWTPVTLTSELVESFVGIYLSPRYDDPRPTPDFHRKAWELYVSDLPNVDCAAPRDHAKSTGLTFGYIMAEVMFRVSDYVILIGSTEEAATEQLSNIADELRNNDDLIRDFGISGFERDSNSDVICVMDDGHTFRILARGAEQRIRGRLWKGKRPNLMVCDDLEDDEQVESKERRGKFRRWFFRAAKQALSKRGRLRVHGTILHEDSLLARLQRSETWTSLFYKAHRTFDDFEEILWPERWSERELRARRQEFIDDGDAAGYSQEFLNDPQDNAEAYLRRDDFIPMEEEDYRVPKKIAVGWDFAVSKADLANRTSCTVGGKDARNLIHFLDFRVGRWSPSVSPIEKRKGEQGWIDVMFEVEKRWAPETHYVEGGQIWKAVENTIYQEMQLRDIYLNIQVLSPIKDKATRGRPFQKQHKAGATRWNTAAEGFEGAREEMLRFTGATAARLDDQFDSAATLCLGLSGAGVVEEEDFDDQDEYEMRHARPPGREQGRSMVTGY